jgi:hypothetical protein
MIPDRDISQIWISSAKHGFVPMHRGQSWNGQMLDKRSNDPHAASGDDAAAAQSVAESADVPVRYIKLGTSGSWAKECFAGGVIRYGTRVEPMELIHRPDHAAMTAFYIATYDQPAAVARQSANQLVDFLTLPPEGIWITFEDDHLW